MLTTMRDMQTYHQESRRAAHHSFRKAGRFRSQPPFGARRALRAGVTVNIEGYIRRR